LFDELLRSRAAALTQKAAELETSKPPDEAFVSWFREGVAFVQSYSGVCVLMASAHADPDMDGEDLFALMSAIGWAAGQPSFAPRANRLLRIIASAILTKPSSNAVKEGEALNWICSTHGLTDCSQNMMSPARFATNETLPSWEMTMARPRGHSWTKR
jgi:hypothetical protein